MIGSKLVENTWSFKPVTLEESVIFMITWKNYSPASRDFGVAMPGSWLNGPARLPFNDDFDFCCVKQKSRELGKPGQPGSCNQALRVKRSKRVLTFLGSKKHNHVYEPLLKYFRMKKRCNKRRNTEV